MSSRNVTASQLQTVMALAFSTLSDLPDTSSRMGRSQTTVLDYDPDVAAKIRQDRAERRRAAYAKRQPQHQP